MTKFWLTGLCIGLLSLGIATACGGDDSSSSPDASPTSSESNQEPSGDNGATSGIEQDPVAVVNGEEISREDLEGQLIQTEASYAQQGVPFPQGAELAELRQQVVAQLIQQVLVVQEAEARNITASDEEVQAAYDEAVGSFPDEETFREAMEDEGLSEEEFEALLVDNIKVEKLVTSILDEAGVEQPTEEELRAFYDEASQSQELPPYEEVRDLVEEQVVNQREGEAIQDFILDLQARSSVEIFLEE